MKATSWRGLLCWSLLSYWAAAAHFATAASPPANDFLVTATVAGSLPFTEEVDTTAATSDTDDAKAQAACPLSIPAGYEVGNSVWYSYVAPTDLKLVVDTIGTEYATLVVVIIGSLDHPRQSSCSLTFQFGGLIEQSTVPAGAHATIYIASVSAFAGLGNGGKLAVTIAGTPPANDRIAHARVIGSLPYSDEMYTYGASSDTDDAQVDTCGIGSGSSVWYKFTAKQKDTSTFIYSIPAQYYAFGFAVGTGSPGNLTPIACGYGFVDFPTAPETTYYVMASGAGRLQLNVIHTPPPPTFDLHFNDTGSIDASGAAHLTGSYKCANELYGFSSAGAVAIQKQGRGDIRELIPSPNFSCDGKRRDFHAATEPGGPRFKPGTLSVESQPLICDLRGCVFFDFKTRKIVLSFQPITQGASAAAAAP